MNLTEAIILGAFVLLLGYDGLTAQISQPTESRVLLALAMSYSTIPLMFGILVGHWFFGHYQAPQVFQSLLNLNLGPLPFLAVSLIFDVLFNHFTTNSYPFWRYPGIYSLIGIPIGSIFWYQIIHI